MTDRDDNERAEDHTADTAPDTNTDVPKDPAQWPREIGGVRGPEPTRYGDWERNGRCSDF